MGKYVALVEREKCVEPFLSLPHGHCLPASSLVFGIFQVYGDDAVQFNLVAREGIVKGRSRIWKLAVVHFGAQCR
jgi:hypothetical protein